MMKKRRKQRPDLYSEKWMYKHGSPAELCRERDGLKCTDCGIEQYTILVGASGAPYIMYLHASHLHYLDPDPVEPIDGQRLRAKCPKCHRLYDLYWLAREVEVEHQCRMHGILLSRQFLMRRFTEVV